MYRMRDKEGESLRVRYGAMKDVPHRSAIYFTIFFYLDVVPFIPYSTTMKQANNENSLASTPQLSLTIIGHSTKLKRPNLQYFPGLPYTVAVLCITSRAHKHDNQLLFCHFLFLLLSSFISIRFCTFFRCHPQI